MIYLARKCSMDLPGYLRPQVPTIASVLPPLAPAVNDTGRMVWCGPVALSAITGKPASGIEALIREYRQTHPPAPLTRAQRQRVAGMVASNGGAATGEATGEDGVVTGTNTREVAAALAAMGWEMACVWNAASSDPLTLRAWLVRPRIAYRHHLIGLRCARVGHWVAIKGVMLADTYSGGAWGFAVGSRHLGARLLDVHEVWKRKG